MGGHIWKFPTQFKIMSPKKVTTGERCTEHTKNLIYNINPKSVYQCNEICVKNRECDHFHHNSATNDCELQKKGYCTLADETNWDKYDPTEHIKVPTNAKAH